MFTYFVFSTIIFLKWYCKLFLNMQCMYYYWYFIFGAFLNTFQYVSVVLVSSSMFTNKFNFIKYSLILILRKLCWYTTGIPVLWKCWTLWWNYATIWHNFMKENTWKKFTHNSIKQILKENLDIYDNMDRIWDPMC